MAAVVSAVLGFGGGMGEVVMDSVRCNGLEQRLEDCRHFGIKHGDFRARARARARARVQPQGGSQ